MACGRWALYPAESLDECFLVYLRDGSGGGGSDLPRNGVRSGGGMSWPINAIF